MKKFLLIFIFSSSFLFSQEYYWTSYSFNVDPEDVETVGKLTDDYFSKEGSKSDGVTVFLFENHFRDGTINASHSLVVYGTQEAMGSQYSSGQNTDFQLYLTKMGPKVTHQQLEKVLSQSVLLVTIQYKPFIG